MTQIRKTWLGRTAIAAAMLGASAVSAVALERGAGDYLAGRHAEANNDARAAAKYYTRALANDPTDARLLDDAMQFQIAAGSPDAAIPAARRLLEANPDHKLALMALVGGDFAREDYAAARSRLLGASDDARRSIIAPLALGWARVAAEPATSVDEAFSGLGEEAVFKVFGAYHRALAKAMRGEREAAIAEFDAAFNATSSPTARLANAYGQTLLAFGEFEKSEAIYAKALMRDPGDWVLQAGLKAAKAKEKTALTVRTAREGLAEAFFGLAGAYARNSDAVRLAQIYTQMALRLAPDLDAAKVLLGDIYAFQERMEEAETAYAGVSADSPQRRTAQIGRADALSQLDRKEDAAAALEALSATNPEDATLHAARGDLYRRFEQYDKAAAAYSDALDAIGPVGERHWRLLFNRGVAYERSGEWDKAELDLKKALEFRPEEARVLNYLGYSWLEMGRNLTEARDMIERAVAAEPDDGYITDSLGWALYQMEDFPGAVANLERAVELKPSDPVINDHLGDALWRVGRKMEARFQWHRALSYDPDDAKLSARIKRKLAEGLDAVLADETVREAAVPAAQTPATAGADNGG